MGLGSVIRDPEKKTIPDPGSATLDHVTAPADSLLHPGIGSGARPLVLPESCYNMNFFLFSFFLRRIGLISRHWKKKLLISGGMASSTPGSGARGRRLSSSSLGDASLFPIYEDPGNESFPLFSDLESMAGSEVSCCYTTVPTYRYSSSPCYAIIVCANELLIS